MKKKEKKKIGSQNFHRFSLVYSGSFDLVGFFSVCRYTVLRYFRFLTPLHNHHHHHLFVFKDSFGHLVARNKEKNNLIDRYISASKCIDV
ncbi:hypothetical protein DERF_010095 [Dermatophagoides farinae]|uniref:Uncharacterized protein n=1 Tax=Dermatophagoides farinae TaxID=6954 RepID=A0A922HXX3_DERFA|nr:hypothetical protein DERF_010095 [Dermatophagoides farinae]